MDCRESLFIYDVHRWMILCFEKWVDPSNKIMMFLIIEVLFKELDLKKLLHEHLMPQFDASTIRYFNHDFTIILCVLFVIELEMTFELLIQSFVNIVFLFHLLEECELVIQHLLFIVL